MLSLLNKLRNKSGNISLMFALLLPLFIVLLGGVLDLTLIIKSKSKIQHSTDMAILAALKKFSDLNIPVARREFEAQKISDIMMETNLYSAGIKLNNFSIKVSKNDGGDNLAIVDWDANIPTVFLRLIGIDQFLINDHVEAKLGASSSKFVDLYVMIDVSSSMGIPATRSGIQQLKNAVNCEFSCHRNHYKNKYAKSHGIKLRMDVVRDAIKDIANKIKALKSVKPDQYRIGLYTFTTWGKTVLPPNSNMDMVINSANNIGVENAHTDLAEGMATLRKVVGRQGSGASPDDRVKLAVYLSDGLHDEPITWPYYTKSIGDVNCRLGQGDDEVKLMGVYTIYEPFSSVHYNSMVRPHKSRLAPDFKKCATKGYFYETSNVSEIKKAFDDIFVEFTIAGGLTLSK